MFSEISIWSSVRVDQNDGPCRPSGQFPSEKSSCCLASCRCDNLSLDSSSGPFRAALIHSGTPLASPLALHHITIKTQEGREEGREGLRERGGQTWTIGEPLNVWMAILSWLKIGPRKGKRCHTPGDMCAERTSGGLSLRKVICPLVKFAGDLKASS